MKRNDLLAKLLAIGGTVLVWLPLLAPLLLSAVIYSRIGAWHFDYLMPAELGIFAAAGALLLLGGALWAHDRRALIGTAAAVALGGLALLFIFPGAMPGTWMMALLVALLVAYAVGLAATGIAGVLLIHDLFRRTSLGATS